ncbi:MAG: hypothetical protein KF787_00470 [Phycisphaeraceae bacterium]|nr:hypothetical protein [Phycisphaerae bacterium]MBX3391096.1 hypothetical protein [Phycisphaeraceae bacterium]
MIRKALFNNGITQTGFLTAFVRGDQTVDDTGQTLGNSVPRYSLPKLLLPAPFVQSKRTGVARIETWGGRSLDRASAALVELWREGNTTKTGISFGGVYPPDATRVKPVGPPLDLAVESEWEHAPQTFIVCDGLVLAFCTATEKSDSKIKAVSVCYWNETIHVDQDGGSKTWEHKYTGPVVQFSDTLVPLGQPRGALWMATGPWVPPGGTDSNGAILECFVAWVDYRANGNVVSGPDGPVTKGSLGGQLFLMRCWRDNVSSKWKLDNPILLYEDVISDARNGSFMHFHTAGITFPGGGTSGRRMVVTLSVGDSSPNNRLVNIVRDDFKEYTQGWGGPTQTTPTAARPSPDDEFPPDSPTQNGWTTHEDREGQRLRIQFTGAVYTPGSPPTLTSTAFANYTQPTGGGVTPIVITAGSTHLPQTMGITGKASPNVIELNRAVAGFSLRQAGPGFVPVYNSQAGNPWVPAQGR